MLWDTSLLLAGCPQQGLDLRGVGDWLGIVLHSAAVQS